MIALSRPLSLVRPLLALALAVGAGAVLHAQLEGTDRGVPPIDSSSSLEVSGIAVDVYAANADAARYGGWREAQRKGWRALWQRTHPGTGVPVLSDSALDGVVAGIVVEEEQIGPRRYIARLGVLFDRARAGQILGVAGQAARSAPMLVLPVQWSGGTAQSLELRNPWQEAWARFRTGNSSIDYIRVTGTGVDPLLLNNAQTWRPGRTWWRFLLDGYGAADVLIPQVRLQRLWPGGPVVGWFSAFHGPDRRLIGRFALRVENSDAIPKLLDAGVRRIDALYSEALAMGALAPDPSLVVEEPVDADALGDSLELAPDDGGVVVAGNTPSGTSAVTVQFDTPDVGAVNATEAAIRGIPGVRSAATSSLAIGGISVMRVVFQGDSAALRAAFAARGWQVQGGGDTLRIVRRAAGAPAPGPSNSPRP
ncbi:heavy-metal-associated domain-containing protein [Sphingomonas flavalba]|uniref:heavy-metal-associated domain-containing protein n=1 Tax=Sphingomonas flavalba TaxID=2559804 RepID=UPI0039DFDACE